MNSFKKLSIISAQNPMNRKLVSVTCQTGSKNSVHEPNSEVMVAENFGFTTIRATREIRPL